eukprot:ANDGO_05521.mRNA.1 hypothetical protein H257_06442
MSKTPHPGAFAPSTSTHDAGTPLHYMHAPAGAPAHEHVVPPHYTYVTDKPNHTTPSKEYYRQNLFRYNANSPGRFHSYLYDDVSPPGFPSHPTASHAQSSAPPLAAAAAGSSSSSAAPPPPPPAAPPPPPSALTSGTGVQAASAVASSTHPLMRVPRMSQVPQGPHDAPSTPMSSSKLFMPVGTANESNVPDSPAGSLQPGRPRSPVATALDQADLDWHLDLMRSKLTSRFDSFREAFLRFDDDRDGLISEDEFRFGVETILGIPIPLPVLHEMFDLFQCRGPAGLIDYETFARCASGYQKSDVQSAYSANLRSFHTPTPTTTAERLLNKQETQQMMLERLLDWNRDLRFADELFTRTSLTPRPSSRRSTPIATRSGRVTPQLGSDVSKDDFICTLREKLGIAPPLVPISVIDDLWRDFDPSSRMAISSDQFHSTFQRLYGSSSDVYSQLTKRKPLATFVGSSYGTTSMMPPRLRQVVSLRQSLRETINEHYASVRDAFLHFDTLKNGKITLAEFVDGLRLFNITPAIVDEEVIFDLFYLGGGGRQSEWSFADFADFLEPSPTPTAAASSASSLPYVPHSGSAAKSLEHLSSSYMDAYRRMEYNPLLKSAVGSPYPRPSSASRSGTPQNRLDRRAV